MQLPPAVAGVTLLSFAGGAPDLFTQLAAVSTGDTAATLPCCISNLPWHTVSSITCSMDDA